MMRTPPHPRYRSQIHPPRATRNERSRRILPALVVLTLALSALVTGARPARVEAATPVTVRITIQRVIGLFCFDDAPFGGCGSSPDFYAKVSVNGGPLVETGQIDDTNDISPNWQFSASVDRDITANVPMQIEIRDEDDTFRGDDDVADISPLSGSAGLTLTLRLGQVPCTFDGGGVTGTCGLPVDVTGAGSDGEALARIIFRVDVINDLPDADGDGIPNAWEQNGVTLNGQVINLPAMGADPNRPDIFIHLDWMQDATRNQALNNAALQQVVTAFANSPYVSPTGSTGINLHIDQGPTSTLNFATGATWGALSRAQAISWQMNLGTLTGGQYNWTQFQGFKSANFEPTGRSPIFHYAIAAAFQEAPAPGQNQNTSSGMSRNDGNQFTSGTSDFLITLGGFAGGTGTTQQQAGTLMHELGHNLGLQHGGGDSLNNYKPNYLSVMNYLFQLRGLDVGGTAGVLDYSRSVLPPVDERALNEGNAIGLAGFGTGSRCPQASPGGTFRSQFTTDANAPYNWNCNAQPSPNGVAGAPHDGVVPFDANGNGTIDGSLTGFDDWRAIQFRGGQIGQLGAVALPLLTDPEPEIPWDQLPPTTTAQLTPAPTGLGWNNSVVTVTLRAADDPGGFGVRDLTYSAAGAQTVGSTTVIGDTASFVVGAEGTTTITFAARDQALNVEVVRTIEVRVDLTDPTVVLGEAYPAPNAAGWHNTDVSVPFTATDGPSGIAATAPPASPLVLTAEGAAVVGTVTATDRADRSVTVTSPAFKIDKTPPVITVTAPIPDQAFDSDGTLTPLFAAADGLSGMKRLAAVLDTGQVVASGETIPLGLLVGRRTLTVTATDVADNVATLVVPFRVRPVFVGVAYDDDNDSAMREAGEAGVGGLVFLDTDGNGRPDAAEASNATSVGGAFRVVGEDVGPARLCTLPVAAERVRTTARCQTVLVATDLPVPTLDFGARARAPGCRTGGVAAGIQSVALAGRPNAYWRPAALAGTAAGPWAGSRLVVRNGGANPAVEVRPGERLAIGVFVGGIDAAQIGNLALDATIQGSHQRLLAVVAADGSVAAPATAPTTAFAYDLRGNQLTIYGLPRDGLGGYQDVWLLTEVTADNGGLTVNAGVAGTVVADGGQTQLRALGNTCNDTAQADIDAGPATTLPGALVVDDIPDVAPRRNPY